MKVKLIDLSQEEPYFNQVRTSIKIVPFHDFLIQRLKEENNPRQSFFEQSMEQFKEVADWDQEITPENLFRFRKIFDIIYFTFTPPIFSDLENIWALAAPIKEKFFYGTDVFYNLLTNTDGTLKKNLINREGLLRIAQRKKRIIYSLILQQFYNYTSNWKSEIIHSYKDETSKLKRFYRLTFDNQFIKIKLNGTPPTIDLTTIETDEEDDENGIVARLQKILPLENFYFEGFSIVRISDITSEYAFDHIKDIVVNLIPGQKVYKDVNSSLGDLLGNQNIDITLLPLLRVNDKLAIDSFKDVDQYLDNHCDNQNFEKEAYLDAINNFIQQPQTCFYSDLNNLHPNEPAIISFFRNKQIKSLGIIPVYQEKQLIGILEILSKHKNEINSQCLLVINPVLPVLRQLLLTTIHEFNQTIDQIIERNFTPLQPATQWRFNEAAWNYLKQSTEGNQPEIEHVNFPLVYPLYGAIDIRNSSKERNQALQSDMYYQLNLLTDLLKKISAGTKIELIDELIFKAYNWGNQVLETITPETELALLEFFEQEARPLLEHFKEASAEFRNEIINYFHAILPDGKAFENRRDLEKSFQLINSTINTALEKMNARIQQIFPCYFEKMRTDGVEYDIYIGQSITPQKKFDTFFLKDLRLLQLTTMASIAQATHELQPQLPKKMETTQLIFIHTAPIDISFRIDERRFDVEGAYNIRYEMAKKRIDKVHIKDSKERLVQPGKIALVYFQHGDIDEYLSYIKYLQEKELLESKVEYLELEYLQGISGLKALRVGVKI